MLNYYDRVLLSIPLTGTVIPSFLFIGGFSVSSAVCIGVAPAVLIIGHALFVQGPTLDQHHPNADILEQADPQPNSRCD